MRIDSSSSYPLDRPARPGNAVTPYRESQRAAEQAREQQRPESASQGLERQPQRRQVEPAIAISAAEWREAYGARQAHATPPLSSHAARALASYLDTAQYRDYSADEVLGLDLYA